MPAQLADALLGGFAPQCLGRVLASVCGGDVEGIQAVIENEDLDQWVRGSAVGGLVTLAATGQKSRDEIVSYFASLFRGKLARQWSNVWDELALCSREICAVELLEDIERAYEEDVIDPGFVSLDEVEAGLSIGKDRALVTLADNPIYHFVEDTAREMEWWACFQDAAEENPFEPEANVTPAPTPRTRVVNPSPAVAIPSLPKVTLVKYATPKSGRNDPCPCGSGKKYKKCCGA